MNNKDQNTKMNEFVPLDNKPMNILLILLFAVSVGVIALAALMGHVIVCM